ncbi:hypothetical protein K1W54_43130 [Micromonospora sp. CPCC 205371]|nr:hypothetical protein [Micromonospora sp. CPCC 205371]
MNRLGIEEAERASVTSLDQVRAHATKLVATDDLYRRLVEAWRVAGRAEEDLASLVPGTVGSGA